MIVHLHTRFALGHGLKELDRVFEEEGVELTEKKLNEPVPILQDVCDNTRIFMNCGHTPDELSARKRILSFLFRLVQCDLEGFMYQVIEKDWKLFRKLLPGWQEDYMDRLTKEYIELLSSEEQASDKFWALDKRLKEDKRRTGVLARGVSRSNMFHLIIDLIYEEAISEDDLADFSEDLRDTVKTRLEIDRRYFEN